ncbi:MAG: HAD family hydrolase [Lentisphaerae bacterium]|nr:HAD family hydrolase [Lentisphaerota bacterium]
MIQEIFTMIKAIIFDINGTVTDIYTSESDDHIWRTTANFLDYHGIKIAPEKLKQEYFFRLKRQKEERNEPFPEFDVVALFASIIADHSGGEDPELSRNTALLFRAAGRYKLQLYDGVKEVLDMLQKKYLLAAVSDGQKIWALPEIESVGLGGFFREVIISSDHGFRKPDRRMFDMALKKLQIRPDEAIYVGNDMFHDIYGAKQAGMKSVFFRSNQGNQEFCGAEADYIIYNFRELPDAVKFLEK